jgi:amino acid transporter
VRSQQASLGLGDAISIIVGIVVGAGIYETPPLVFQNVSGPWTGLAVWVLAGLLSLVGALCYAELATAYPRSGGDYVYLTRAYGPFVGFLFGWAQLAVILTGSIGMMAYVFADYAVKLVGLEPASGVAFAAAAVIVLTALNLLGVVLGKRTQNVLTAAKVLGLAGVVAVGLLGSQTSTPVAAEAEAGHLGFQAFAFAMVLVFLTYGGWNDAAYVAAEVQDGRRNIPRALLLGTLGITGIYVLVNAAYLVGLGFEGARQSKAVAADLLANVLGPSGGRAISLLVMISALGALNGLIFTGSRLYSALGSDYSALGWLGRWHVRRGSPAGSLLIQAAISLTMILLVGTTAGRSVVNAGTGAVGVAAVAWEGHGGFETLLRCTAPVFWLFFLLTALSLFVLRYKDGAGHRPFLVPLYPVVPLLFCLTCAYMLYGSVGYAGTLGLLGVALLLAGVPVYLISRRQAPPRLSLVPGSAASLP